VSDNHKDYMGTDKEKEAAGAFAAEAIKEGMTVGVGTGTTAFFFIKALGFRCRNGLNIKALASSQASYELLKTEGIPLLSFDETPTLDITVDGADEITKDKHMIKGGGGALLREKIVAASSREMLVIVDEGKVKEKLGAAKLPIEIIPFYHEATLHKVNAHGYRGTIRGDKGGVFRTDGGHFIYDITLENPLDDPIKTHELLLNIPGVIETGIFYNLAGRVVIGKGDGEVELWQ